jgi:hypothetical protein
MKINEVIVEGIFSSVADVFSVDRYKKQDPEKRQAKIQNLFLKDFIADFYADLQANIKAGVIGANAPAATQTQQPAATQTQQPTPAPAINQPSSSTNITEQQQIPMNNWIVKWFNAYMQGVDWQQQRSTVETLAQDIAKTYKKSIAVGPAWLKKSTVHVKELANLAWELTGEQNKSPRGFGNVSSSYSSRNQADTLTGKDLAQNPKKIEQFIDDRTEQELENLKKAIAKVRP